MQFIGTMTWLFAGLVACFSVMAFSEDDGKIMGFVLAIVAVILFVAAYHLPTYGWSSGSSRGGDCYTDWDGRSNPIVCD